MYNTSRRKREVKLRGKLVDQRREASASERDSIGFNTSQIRSSLETMSGFVYTSGRRLVAQLGSCGFTMVHIYYPGGPGPEKVGSSECLRNQDLKGTHSAMLEPCTF